MAASAHEGRERATGENEFAGSSKPTSVAEEGVAAAVAAMEGCRVRSVAGGKPLATAGKRKRGGLAQNVAATPTTVCGTYKLHFSLPFV